MADNYLERQMEKYLRRKEAFYRKKRHLPQKASPLLTRPEDEAL